MGVENYLPIISLCVSAVSLSFLVVMCRDRDPMTCYEKFYLFDMDWNYRPEYVVSNSGDHETLKKPLNFEAMKEYARTLSSDFEFVRVDLYDAGDSVYFGELTFIPYIGRLEDFTDTALFDMYAKL